MKKIKLTQGKYALVDDDDFERVNQFKWCYRSESKNNNGYAIRAVNKTTISLHRFLLNLEDRQIQVDHVNGNGLDNRRVNLRNCLHLQNGKNRRIGNNNKSGYKGVCFDKKACKYKSEIKADEKRVWLGYFNSPIEAAKAYNAKALELHGEFARLNIIPEDNNE